MLSPAPGPKSAFGPAQLSPPSSPKGHRRLVPVEPGRCPEGRSGIAASFLLLRGFLRLWKLGLGGVAEMSAALGKPGARAARDLGPWVFLTRVVSGGELSEGRE